MFILVVLQDMQVNENGSNVALHMFMESMIILVDADATVDY